MTIFFCLYLLIFKTLIIISRQLYRRQRVSMSNDVSRLQEQRMKLEQELMRTERQIYELEGEYLQETLKDGNVRRPKSRCDRCDLCGERELTAAAHTRLTRTGDASLLQALRGWDGYLGKQASSGAIRRINRYREADRMFSFSSVTTGQAAYVTKVRTAPRRRRHHQRKGMRWVGGREGDLTRLVSQRCSHRDGLSGVIVSSDHMGVRLS